MPLLRPWSSRCSRLGELRMSSCSPSPELQRWCCALQEEEESQSLAVPGCESPRRPLSRTVPGPPRAPRWHGARLPTAALGDPRVPAPLTSAAAGALRRAQVACTRQGQGNGCDTAGPGTEMLQAAPGTTQHSTAKNLARPPSLAELLSRVQERARLSQALLAPHYEQRGLSSHNPSPGDVTAHCLGTSPWAVRPHGTRPCFRYYLLFLFLIYCVASFIPVHRVCSTFDINAQAFLFL